MKQIFAVAVLFVATLPCLAQEPVARITAPASVPAGQVVWIRSDGSVADDYAWYTSAPAHTYNVSDDKRSITFQSVEPKSYLFVLSVVKDNKIATTGMLIAVGGGTPVNPPQPGPEPFPSPGPNPSPSPAPNPTPSTTLAEAAKMLCEQHVPKSSRSNARRLSGVITALTSEVSAVPSSWTPRRFMEELRVRDRIVLDGDKSNWIEWSKEISGLIGAAMRDDPENVQNLVSLWRQVAQGLNEVE